MRKTKWLKTTNVGTRSFTWRVSLRQGLRPRETKARLLCAELFCMFGSPLDSTISIHSMQHLQICSSRRCSHSRYIPLTWSLGCGVSVQSALSSPKWLLCFILTLTQGFDTRALDDSGSSNSLKEQKCRHKCKTLRQTGVLLCLEIGWPSYRKLSPLPNSHWIRMGQVHTDLS